jgi:hypothetical protein
MGFYYNLIVKPLNQSREAEKGSRKTLPNKKEEVFL